MALSKVKYVSLLTLHLSTFTSKAICKPRWMLRMDAVLSIFKSEMSSHAVRSHYKQFTLFSWMGKNTYMFLSAWMVDILSILCNSCAKTPKEVLLVTCKLKKFYFILMWSTNFTRFQLTALALCDWLTVWWGRGSRILYGWWRRYMNGKSGIMFNFYGFTPWLFFGTTIA
jgi:hypothetical protein